MPEGRGLLIETLFGWLGSASSGGRAPREDKLGAQTYVEYGLTERLTAVGALSAQRFAMSAPRDVSLGLDTAEAGVRARLWSDEAWVCAAQASAFYAGGAGPGAEARVLLGRNLTLFGAPAFVDAQAAYRLRTGGPPSEWRGDLTLGIDATSRAQILFQVFNTLSDGPGRAGFASFETHKGEVSLLYALDENWSAQIGAFTTIWRRNGTRETGAALALWRRF